MKTGPIVLIEDDLDDKKIFEEVLGELKVENKLAWFTNCPDAFLYLKETDDQPFIIFSDVNLPVQNGLDFKRQVDADPELRRKCIPFIFYSTSVDLWIVNEAYTQLTVQGFFQKHHSYPEIMKNLKMILDYWKSCRHPNTQ